jgi:hypothetical protein
MAVVRNPVPKPKPFEGAPPPPEVLAALQAPPASCLRVTQTVAGGQQELAVIFKRSYTFDTLGACRLADEQSPLEEEAIPHDELRPGVPPSFRALPETVGFKTGTDLVVQGSACPQRPLGSMTVAVQVGFEHKQVIQVFGKRICDYVNGKLVFTPPETFEEMPLKYENAYGGRDSGFESAMKAEVERTVPAEDLQKSRAVLGFLFGANHPLMYPRNRFGKGYVVENRPDAIRGRELPNLERPDDLLTPDRLALQYPFAWPQQPLPAGFDFLDPLSFPRSAMLGMPPACNEPWDRFPEVKMGLVPSDFCRGNVFGTSPENLASLFHPNGSRCASLGLQLPFLQGNEPVLLEGVDRQAPLLRVTLPRERPTFTLAGQEAVETELHLVHLKAPQKMLHLVWVGRIPFPRPFFPGEDRELEKAVQVQLRRI